MADDYDEFVTAKARFEKHYGYDVDGSEVNETLLPHQRAIVCWSDLGMRIGDRAKPLAAKTMRRIEAGIRRFARPTVLAHTGQTWDAAHPGHPGFGDPGSYYRVQAADGAPLMARQAGGTGDAVAVPPHLVAVNHDGDERARLLAEGPLATRSTKIGDGLIFPPTLVPAGGSWNTGAAGMDDPMRTRVTRDFEGLAVPPFVTEFYGMSTARGIDEALSTVTAGAQHHALTVPPGVFLSRQYGSRGNEQHLNTSVGEPTHPITASGGGNHALVVPERGKGAVRYEGELPFALDDVRFRMLGPREHLRAQRFAEDYDTSAANKSETTKGAGNAVAVNVAHWLGDQIKEVL